MKKKTIISLVIIQVAILLLVACGQKGPLPSPDKIPPVVKSTVPSEGYTDFPINGTIKATFNEEMDPATISALTITLASAGIDVPGSVVYTDAAAIFTPSQLLKEGTVYTVTVSDSVKDAYGNPLERAYQFSFTTHTYPGVQSTIPAKDASNVPVNAGVNVTFSKPINADTLLFSLLNASNGTIECNSIIDPNGINAQFIPKVVPPEVYGLTGNTQYTAKVSAGLQDRVGNVMQNDFVWTFRTGAGPDTVPPSVQSTVPADGATDVSVNPSILVIFSELVKSFPTTTLTLFSAGTVTIPCQRIDFKDTTHTFTPVLTPPAVSLAYNTLYTSTLSAGAQDGVGNAMLNTYSWTFTTTLAPTTMTISAPDVAFGANVSVRVTVTSPAGTPAGTVSWSMDGGATTIQALDSNGIATFTITKPSRGSHVISATYVPQNGSIFRGSAGSAVFSVGQNTSSMSLTSSANPSTYGTQVTFTATVNAGATGTVTFKDGATVLDMIVLTGNTASYSTAALSAGNHAITATYSGDGNFSAATATLTPAQQVNKAALTVTANNASKAYNTPNPSFTAINSGFVNGESSAVLSGAPSLTTTATIASPAGSYPITAALGTLSAANYSFNFVNGTLTIINVNATVTLSNLNQMYDGSPKSVTATTNPANLTVNITYNGSATVPTNAGSYTVVGTISDPNYTGTNSGTLFIAKAAATVSLGNLNQTYDGTSKAATAITIPNGLPVAFTYNGSITHPVNVGSYAVVGTIVDANYQGSNTGTMTISKANQAITFGALTDKTMVDTPFTVSATASSGLAVSFASQTPSVCTVTGNTVTLIATGTCTVRASQAGDSNYSAATNVDRSFTVNSAGQTISVTTPAPGTAVYNTTFPVAATASSNLPVAITASGSCSGTGSGSATITMNSGTGTCTVHYNQAGNGTYGTAPEVTSNTTAQKAGQTISVTTPAPGTAVYNTTFPVAATASSNLPVAITASGSCSGTGSGSATITMNSGTGTCTVHYNQAGNGTYGTAPEVTSNTTAQKAGQTISVTTPAPGTAEFNTTFPVAATASSNLPVAITASGSCSGTGSGSATITMNSATGTCTVHYNQAGNGNYGTAPEVTSNTTAQKAGQTISVTTAAPGTAGYHTNFPVSATASSSLPVAITASGSCSGTGSGSATITMNSGTGTCTVHYNQTGNGNYGAALEVTSNTTAQKAGQTITFDSLANSKVGDPPFTLGATANSGLTVSYTSSDPSVATVSDSTLTIVGAGDTMITASQSGDANYNPASDVQQGLKVTP